jgi:hypothetical protein
MGILATPASGAAGLTALSRTATPKSAAATSSAAPGSDSGASSGSSGASGRITEIIPSASSALGTQASAARSAGMPPIGADTWVSADPCVNVFVRSSKVDGREVVSVDLHGDGLIKGAVPPHLAGQLLARAGPAAGGARAACVPPALAQNLFNPVVNVAAVDPAVRMVRVGDRWVLAGSRAPEPVAKAQAPVQLAAATTRGAVKKPTKNSTKRAKPATLAPTQIARVNFP